MPEDNEFPIPPASFSFLVESIMMQAQIQLGLFRLGQDEQEEAGPNLPLARHSIDMLAMLQQKTKDNLSLEEQRLIDNGLTEMRFRFVQVSDELKRGESEQVSEPAASKDEPSKDDAPRIITADGGKGTKSA
ncbi:MAG TPA: DUF1844 domain-containing protein [Bryobacteraceae bacterium]|jgi:hypothetical protein|nr:DUF1844 domain-containing protein [Bryobacteraceae bacterium]